MSDTVPTGGAGAPDSAPPVKRCRCGHARTHVMVSAEPRYTRWGTFWVIFMGVSATPIKLEFKCRVCGETFDSTDDPKDLATFL